MSKPKNDIAQIKKYLQGGLDSHAMHDLERRALDDPFLADALEGYEKTGDKQQRNLDELSQRLQSRVDKKVRSMLRWAQLSIAASLLIVIGIGIWLVVRNKAEKPNFVAATVKTEKQTQPTISAPSALASPINTDTTPKPKTIVRQPSPDNEAAVPPATESIATAEMPKAVVAGVKNDTLKSVSNAYAAPLAYQKMPAPNADKQVQYKSTDKQDLSEVIVQDANKQAGLSSQSVKKAPQSSPETQLQGHVDGLDVQPAHRTLTGYVMGAIGGQPLTGAIVKLAGANFGVVTDANGKFVLHDVPDKKSLVVKYIGYNAKQVSVNASDSITVTLEPAGTALNETTISSPNATKASGGSSPLADAHPSAGWKALTDYLDKNAVSPDGATGNVRVSFMVDGKGSLSNFTIIKSVSTVADQKAIDLLTNGPGWVGNIDGKAHEVKVTVKFH